MRRSPRKLAKSVSHLARWLVASRRTNPAPTVSVRPVTAFDRRIDAFWAKASRQFEFIQVRDFAYLSWRYDRRGGDFTILLAEDGGGIAGYAVLCVDITGAHASIADLLALPGREDVARDLVFEALAWARTARCTILTSWLPERHPYRAAFEAAGFVRRHRRTPAAYRATGAVPEEDLAFLQERGASVHMMLGDSDVV